MQTLDKTSAISEDDAPPQPARESLAFIGYAVNLLYAANLGALGLLLPPIGATFQVGSAVLGRLIAANFGGALASVLLSGYLSDRLGRKSVLLGGIAAYALGMLLFGGASAFDTALWGMGLVGAGCGTMQAVANALISDLFPLRRAILLNRTQIAFGTGAVATPFLAQALLGRGTDWRTFCVGLAVFSAFCFAGLLFQRVPRAQAHGSHANKAALRAVFRSPLFWMLLIAQAFYAGAEVGFFSWMPTYFHARLIGGTAWEGLVVSLFWIGMTIGRALTETAIKRLSLLRFRLLLTTGGAVASTLALLGGTPATVLPFVILTGLCFSGVFSTIIAEAGERFPKAAGTVYGFVAATGSTGAGLFPWLIGVLSASALGWRGGMAVVPLLAVSVAALTFWMQQRSEI